ncbi:hypothetical protein DWY25_01050 [Holdemania filiformis]|uniref:Uncharacterized protein n=1 Tax=Holdemania filiformis TaxID=61171 RepID=A0A412G6I8_9FIRM|nr:hypothetical protein DWY25_01050 [Holdemania filiformis]
MIKILSLLECLAMGIMVALLLSTKSRLKKGSTEDRLSEIESQVWCLYKLLSIYLIGRILQILIQMI